MSNSTQNDEREEIISFLRGLNVYSCSNSRYDVDKLEEDVDSIIELLADARREDGLKHYMRVSEHLRQYGRDRIMKKDERAEGFYEAIKELERYFGLSDVLATLREEEGVGK